ncbi:thioredoxin family protein [Salsipaludibacter albus]|uniref:thioredoxin family protein n=1 Tax=Salsipaludibacter albus TaxID=2849650 RepID=UPI001EE4299B|nr:thioredoxin family protein [Salsipaludibacter albus]MBY5161115.1 thioredoxin family protein [Salsipaludibacter albus]
MIARAVMVGWLVLLVVLVARWWQSRDGRVRVDTTTAAPPVVTSAVLVSTPTCRTCPQVRILLDDLARHVDGFGWEEVDASKDVAFVRRHGVMRAPTVLLRARDGSFVGRAAGTIDRESLAAAVGATAVPVA